MTRPPLVLVSGMPGADCAAPVDVVRARFAARSGTPARHPCHPDAEILAEGIEHWPERYGRPELGVPWLDVDTTDGYRPSLDAIVGWV